MIHFERKFVRLESLESIAGSRFAEQELTVAGERQN